MSSLRERIEGLVAELRKRGEADTASGKLENPWVLEVADELSAALAAEGQGDGAERTFTAQQMLDAFRPWAQLLGKQEAQINDFLAGPGAAAPSLHKEGLSAEDLQTLEQIRARSKDSYQAVGDEQDGFAMAELDVAWLLDYIVNDSPATLHKEGLPAIEKLIRLIEASRDGFLDGRPYILTYSDIIEELKAMLPTERAALHKEGVNSRSEQKRMAALKGEPAPTFEGAGGAPGELLAVAEWAVYALEHGSSVEVHWLHTVAKDNHAWARRVIAAASPAGRADCQCKFGLAGELDTSKCERHRQIVTGAGRAEQESKP